MIRRPLHDGWMLSATGDVGRVPEAIRAAEVPASVPGCVHTDLLAAGLIADPYVGRNELGLQWIGETDWRYRCRFEVGSELLAHDHLELVCEGLDTVAAIELNGSPVGETENMHLGHRFDVGPLLRAGENRLEIVFTSALRYGRAMRDRLGDLPNVSVVGLPFNFVRKMACNFGWDWGPTLVTAGIWQPLCLQAWSGGRIASVRPLVTRADAERAELEVRAELAGAAQGLELACALTDPAGNLVAARSVTIGGDDARVDLTVERPRLWWPNGRGAQPLYGLSLELKGDRGATLDRWNARVGLRTVRLNTEPDEVGSAFTIEINGEPVFCKGANWIPDDCFPSRVDEARYRRRLEQAAGVGMNMLRVWGGGIYENEAFYRACDELGLMVWQDFLFACAAYPEEPPFDALVEAEARYQITRLAKHPSLVLWNGNNENIWGFFDWDKGGRPWREVGEERSWGLGFYLDLLPRLVGELDPSRPYWPGSPYSGSMEIHPNDDEHGCKHVWDAWNEKDYTVYRDYVPRFVAEFGHQAPPTYATLRHAIPADELSPSSPAMLHHQKAVRGNDKLAARLAEHFDPPEDFDAWHYLTQVNQARAMQLGVEWFRSRRPVCMGALFWQLNDCWPVISWAAVDGHGRPKPLHFASRRFFADRLLTLQPAGAALELRAVNDGGEPWTDRVVVRRLGFDGEELAAQEATVSLGPGDARLVCRIDPAVAVPTEPAAELIVAEGGGARALWFFERDRELHYPAPRFHARLEREGPAHRLTVTAETLLRDLCVFPDRLDPEATIDDQLVTLLPGETVALVIDSARALDLEALTTRPVFACLNDMVGRGGSPAGRDGSAAGRGGSAAGR